MQDLLGIYERHTTRQKVIAGAVAMLQDWIKYSHTQRRQWAMVDSMQFSKDGLQRLHKDLAAYVASDARL
jgi:hypothetical protein